MGSFLPHAARVAFASLLQLASATALRSDEPKPIADLIARLGSGRQAERDAATQSLKSRNDAAPLLRKAIQTGNAETRRRAQEIMVVIMNRRLPTYLEYGRRGRIDVMTEWLGMWEGPLDNEALWQPVIDIAWELANRSGFPQLKRKDILKHVIWDPFVTAYKPYRENLAARSEPTFLINPETLENPLHPFVIAMVCGRRALSSKLDCEGSFIVNAATVKLQGIGVCIIFANDDVTIDVNGSTLSVVVTDGSFRSKGAHDVVVAARKDVTVKTSPARYSLLHAGGKVTMPPADPKKPPLGNNVKEGAQRPLDFVRFFETADVGIEVVADKGEVKVDKLVDGWPLAKAGLHVGDVILSVDGVKSPDGETIRRQLRRGFVQDGALIQVRRGDKVIDLTVDFYGFDLLKGT